MSAGIYAGRKKIKTALIADSFGGQSLVSADIQNWIGTKSVSGYEFAKMLEDHLRAQEVDIVFPDLVEKIEKSSGGFKVFTKSGKVFDTKTVLAASGSRHKKLSVPGEEKFNGKGVAYCSTCDAPVFNKKITAVVGGGNSGLEAVLDLLSYSPKIYLLDHGDRLKGDQITQEKIKFNPKVEIIFNAETLEILGDKFVTGLKYKNLKDGKVKELKLDGVFVEIGSMPNVEYLKGLIKLDEYGEIIVDHKTQQTSQPGIWAAGDATDVLYKQNNISAGDAVKAVLDIYNYLSKN